MDRARGPSRSTRSSSSTTVSRACCRTRTHRASSATSSAADIKSVKCRLNQDVSLTSSRGGVHKISSRLVIQVTVMPAQGPLQPLNAHGGLPPLPTLPLVCPQPQAHGREARHEEGGRLECGHVRRITTTSPFARRYTFTNRSLLDGPGCCQCSQIARERERERERIMYKLDSPYH